MKENTRKLGGVALATGLCLVLAGTGLPATALAASDTQKASSEWFEIKDMRPENPDHIYHWKTAATVTVTDGTVTGLTLSGRADAGGAVPEMEEPYFTPVKKIFEADVPEMGIQASDYETAVDGIDTVSGATQTSHWAKEALKSALKKWNENHEAALPAIQAMDALGTGSTATEVRAARTAYDALGSALQDYVPTASYAKLMAAESAVTPEPEPVAKNAKSFTVNVATVSAGAVKSAAAKAGATAKSATAATVGAKAKRISKGAFKGFKNVKTLDVKSTKLTKKSVKGSLSGSGVTTVKVPKSKKVAYEKAFAKGNCGKKVTVK